MNKRENDKFDGAAGRHQKRQRTKEQKKVSSRNALANRNSHPTGGQSASRSQHLRT